MRTSRERDASDRRGLIAHLSRFVTPSRLEKIEAVLEQRTRYLTVVLEDIYQPHNASAVLRSCDGFGVQDAYIVENRNTYRINPGVELGTSKWLNLTRFGEKSYNTLEAVSYLRERGYRIVATSPREAEEGRGQGAGESEESPDPEGVAGGGADESTGERAVEIEGMGSDRAAGTAGTPLEEFDLEKGKTALFFGNELDGLTEEMMQGADEHLYIPMYGFVESFNISVSCALTLHYLTHELRQSTLEWALTEGEKEEIMLEWLRNSITRWETIEEEWRKTQNEG